MSDRSGAESPFGYQELFAFLAHATSISSNDEKLTWIKAIGDVVGGGDPASVAGVDITDDVSPSPTAFLGALQAVALQEHRHFASTEEDGGGRWLVGELSLGLLLGRWSAPEAAAAAIDGHIGLRRLRSESAHLGLLPRLNEYLQRLTSASTRFPSPNRATSEREPPDEQAAREIALNILADIVGGKVAFRPNQWEAIRGLVLDGKRILLVQRTGWGKSAVYFIATRLLREAGRGPTLLISPLLSLMRNQVEMAERAGIRSATINSSNEGEHLDIYGAVTQDDLDLLLVTPEWVSKPSFRVNVLDGVKNAGLVVIDEAHCISDWGHDFRPDYRRLVRLLDELDPETPVLGTTATATKRVVLDIADQFGDTFEVVRGPLARPGLRFSVFADTSKAARLARLRDIVSEAHGTGIVYCLTVGETKRVAEWLSENGVNAVAYNAKLDDLEKLRVEESLMNSDVDVVIATSALGMGFDKPDIEFVVHLQSPSSIIEYYQQAGRAGRGIPESRAVLMVGGEDALIHDFFFESAFITEREADEVLDVLSTSEWRRMPQIELAVNMSTERLEKALKLLEVEGAVIKTDSRWMRSQTPWTFDHDRPRRVKAQRRLERGSLRRYAASAACRERFLLEELDDIDPSDCGICDVCSGETELEPSASDVNRIESELAEVPIWIPPKDWIAAKRPYRIGWRLKHQFGRALCVLGEGRLGQLVQDGVESRSISEEIVAAAAEMFGEWKFREKPQWVSSVPTDSRNDYVADAAQRLAERLRLPYNESLYKTRSTLSMSSMMNDSQRYANLAFAFDLIVNIPSSSLLLVDDFINTGWTFAITSMTLRKSGEVAAVTPFAFSKLYKKPEVT